MAAAVPHNLHNMFYSQGVSNAGWNAGYDVYVKTDTKEKPVSLLYKASIFQSTGEVSLVFINILHRIAFLHHFFLSSMTQTDSLHFFTPGLGGCPTYIGNC